MKEKNMEAEFKIGETRIRLVRGDITKQDTQAIVNAANSSLLGGGGVDGAIHRAGGPKILEECREIVSKIGSLPPGEAVATTGGSLKARFVIHTVGPIWQGGTRREEEILGNAYKNSLDLAVSKGISSISFPSISTGAYGFPVEKAAAIAINTAFSFVRENPLEEIRFILFSENDFRIYNEEASRTMTG
jgi:O-acetyl-ADP-ribose deacetylase (regulator of RNase III)